LIFADHGRVLNGAALAAGPFMPGDFGLDGEWPGPDQPDAPEKKKKTCCELSEFRPISP